MSFRSTILSSLAAVVPCLGHAVDFGALVPPKDGTQSSPSNSVMFQIALQHDDRRIQIRTVYYSGRIGTMFYSQDSPSGRAIGIGDLKHDGHDDIIILTDSGQLIAWPFGQFGMDRFEAIHDPVDLSRWSAVGVGDVNGDYFDDILWQDKSGQMHFWAMVSGARRLGLDIFTPVNTWWTFMTTGDIDGDGYDDLLWRHRNGQVHVWLMDAGRRQSAHNISDPVGSDWRLIAAYDLDRDGTDDLIFQHKDNHLHYWKMQNGTRAAAHDLPIEIEPGWRVLGFGTLTAGPRTEAQLQ